MSVRHGQSDSHQMCNGIDILRCLRAGRMSRSCFTLPTFVADRLKAFLPFAPNAGLYDVCVIVVLGTELGSKGIVIVRSLNTMDLMLVTI
ncbi:hypothetical protein AS149_06995 [Burkholderia cenocepacia]|nr:hypothetical protein AS149_06995 [Burkholderia cenocepacia]